MRLIFAGNIGGRVCRAHGPDAINQCVTVKGKPVYFDFDEMFGPLVVDKHGQPLKRQPISETDPFWPPFNRWLAEYRMRKRAAA